MSMAKIAISIDNLQLKKIDHYVDQKIFKNRSQAFQLSIEQVLQHLEHSRLAAECSKLDVQFEQDLADVGLNEDLESWPKY